MKYLKKGILFIITVILLSSCGKENNEPYKSLEGYIVGFAPCTINHHYRIGYVIISTDLKDTLVTYNLSDDDFKMPASILVNSSDTLYKIPESYFQNYRNSGYFPNSTQFEFGIKITYEYASEEDKVYNLCTTDINQSDFNNAIQIIVKTTSKY